MDNAVDVHHSSSKRGLRIALDLRWAPCTLCLFLLSCAFLIPSCDDQQLSRTDREASPRRGVTLAVNQWREIDETPYGAPAGHAPLFGAMRHIEIWTEVAVRNETSRALIFDELRATYYLDEEVACETTSIVAANKGPVRLVGPRYDPELLPEDFGPNTRIRLPVGHEKTFKLKSANANYGNQEPGSRRHIEVALFLEGNQVGGVLRIGVPGDLKGTK